MNRILLCLVALLLGGTAVGQHSLIYQSYAKDVKDGDTTYINVIEQQNTSLQRAKSPSTPPYISVTGH